MIEVMRWLVLLLCGCGRIGFAEGSASSGVPDAIDPDALAACHQAEPFLAYIDVFDASGNGSVQRVRYCYAGLAGPLTASLLHGDLTVLVETTVPIAGGMADLL